MHFLLPADLGTAILNYLAERPYREVAAFVAGLQQLQPAEAPAEPFTREQTEDASPMPAP